MANTEEPKPETSETSSEEPKPETSGTSSEDQKPKDSSVESAPSHEQPVDEKPEPGKVHFNTKSSKVGAQVGGNVNNSTFGLTGEEFLRGTQQNAQNVTSAIDSTLEKFTRCITEVTQAAVRAASYERSSFTAQPPGKPIEKHPINISEFALPSDRDDYARQFEQLRDEEKLFVIILYLFPDIPWTDFWLVYEQAITTLPVKSKPKPSTNAKTRPNEVIIKVVQGEVSQDQSQTVAEDPDEEKDEVSPLHRARSRSDDYWTKWTHAEISLTTYEYPEGKQTKQTINFREQAQDVIKTHIRTTQRQWLMSLLPVLKEMAGLPSISTDLRKMIAEAVATIADIDFGYVTREVLDTWSCSDEAYIRVAAGYTLQKIFILHQNDAEVIRLLDFWADPGKRTGGYYWQQCWTAAFTYHLIGIHKFDLVKSGLTSLGHLPGNLENFSHDLWEEIIRISEQYQTLEEVSKSDQEIIQNRIAILEVLKEAGEEIPDAIMYTLVMLALNNRSLEVIMLMKEWINTQPDPAKHRIRNFIIFGVLKDTSFSNFYHKKSETAAGNEHDFLTLFQVDKDFRKYLADILTYLLPLDPDLRQGLFSMLQTWTIEMAKLDLDIQSIKKLLVNIYRRSSQTQRKHILTAMKHWTKHKHQSVQVLGYETIQKLETGDYSLPEKPGGRSGKGPIVFGRN
ncbi:MAG: hypothetical protein HC884_09025 [Chloroflexaceae bacterium]|nr:hypothetical protein [Chloroflexaceae bacterium]